ncbi:MAG: folylpolyglutamate synthase/dihydrofolate synthase family protein [bacterium]
MNFEETLQKIYSLHQFDIKLGLDKITELLKYLGNPQNNFESIHIAGSNGKGSTSSYIASVLMEAGYKTGLYTSPHVVDFNERIRINSATIEDEYIKDFINSLDLYIKKHSPTFFEITTALAFKYFGDNNIEIGVIETGLGGRLDATNVLNPIATVITTLSLEHTNILGNDIKSIAYEKAGIIKKGVNCFSGIINREAEEVLETIATKNNAEILFIKNYIDFNEIFCNINIENFRYHLYNPVFLGNHQFLNLSLAILTLVKTKKITDWLILNRGINNVIKNSGLQGRYEIINNKPKIIMDAAHNSEGIQSFVKQFTKEINLYNTKKIIFGAMKDKNIKEMLAELKPYFNKFYFTKINYERAISPSELVDISLQMDIECDILESPDEFINNFKTDVKNNNNCLVVLGSIYLLGQIKKSMIQKKYLTI